MVHLYAALLQIPGMDNPELTFQEQLSTNWEGMGFMRWPLAFCLGLGVIVIIVKFVTLTAKASKTKRILKDVDRPHARRLLTAAALTYVSASLMSLLNVARWWAILRR